MADITIKDIGDRLDAINITIGSMIVDGNTITINTSRYYPTNVEDSFHHPLLIPVYTSEARVRTVSDEIIETQQWSVIAVTGALLKGIQTETTQKTNEIMIQTMKDTYDGKNRLQNSDNGLAFTDKVFIQNITIGALSESISMIRFQFQMTIEHITEQE